YRSVMPTGRFPVIVLNLTIPPEEVDVNVHPSKAEVRFRRSGEIFRRLSATVRRALASSTEVAPARLDRPVVDQFFFPSGNARWDSGPPPPSRHLGAGGGPPPPPDDQQPEPAPGLRSPVMRPLGQVENTYIVAAGPRGLYLIDQHAAHERVLFERLGNIADTPTQRLLDPTSVELSAEESDWVAAHADDLRTLGFDVTAFGPSAWLLRAVPSALGRIDAATYLREVVAEAQTPDFQRLAAADRLRWSLACGAAIKSGAPLAFDEMSALIRDLEACDLGLTCPHGRPTVILLSRQLLDREFGRT
ncbi:MAG: DNA mismatch repair protein MutL, partial [Chloroflexota bacterium]|nr:DNA mismatch repair protein MutL [Chloroflexota bacterium]